MALARTLGLRGGGLAVCKVWLPKVLSFSSQAGGEGKREVRTTGFGKTREVLQIGILPPSAGLLLRLL